MSQFQTRYQAFKQEFKDLTEVDTVVSFDPASLQTLFIGLVISAALMSFLYFYFKKMLQ